MNTAYGCGDEWIYPKKLDDQFRKLIFSVADELVSITVVFGKMVIGNPAHPVHRENAVWILLEMNDRLFSKIMVVFGAGT